MEELLELLDLTSMDDIDSKFTKTFENYNEFTDCYNMLENSLDVNRDSNESYMEEDDIYILFEGNNFKIELTGSLVEDNYKLELTKE